MPPETHTGPRCNRQHSPRPHLQERPRRDDTDARKAPYALCDPHGNLVPCRGTYILYHETNVFGFTRRRRCSQFKDYTITYNEAKSIINAGFNLVPKASLDLAGQHGINLRISNYYNPNKQTITITKTSTMNQIKAVVTRKNADYLQIHSSGNLMPFQFLTKVMAVCGDFKTPIHLISSSSVNISMAVELSSETFHQMENQLSQFASVSVEKDISVIHIIGQFDQEKENMEVKVIDLLKDIPILMISYGSDNNSVSVVVSKDMGEKAQAILMDNFAGQDFMKRNVAPRFREAYSAMSI